MTFSTAPMRFATSPRPPLSRQLPLLEAREALPASLEQRGGVLVLAFEGATIRRRLDGRALEICATMRVAVRRRRREAHRSRRRRLAQQVIRARTTASCIAARWQQ